MAEWRKKQHIFKAISIKYNKWKIKVDVSCMKKSEISVIVKASGEAYEEDEG